MELMKNASSWSTPSSVKSVLVEVMATCDASTMSATHNINLWNIGESCRDLGKQPQHVERPCLLVWLGWTAEERPSPLLFPVLQGRAEPDGMTWGGQQRQAGQHDGGPAPASPPAPWHEDHVFFCDPKGASGRLVPIR